MDSLGRSYHVPKDPDGVISGTPRQLDVLQFIYRHPYAPTHFIDAYFNLAYYAKEICAELFAKGYVNKFIKAFHTTDATGSLALMPKNCWAPTDKGSKELQCLRPTQPFIPLGRFNDHQLNCALVGTGIAFGARETGITLTYADDILSNPDCPPLDPKDKSPFIYKISKRDRYIADARPFKLRYAKRYMFLWGWELDRGTETINSEAQNAILNKFKHQEAFLEEDVHFKRFNMRNINFPYFFPNRTRMLHVIDLLKTTVQPKWHDCFWFTTFTDCAPNLDFPPPTGRVLTGEWWQTTGRNSLVNFLKGESSDRRSETATAYGVESAA